jgi:hypothetical protein
MLSDDGGRGVRETQDSAEQELAEILNKGPAELLGFVPFNYLFTIYLCL